MLRKITWGVLIIFFWVFNVAVVGAQLSSSATDVAQNTATNYVDDQYLVGYPIDDSVYKLGPGDELAANIIIGDNDMALDHTFVIGPDGKIFFPKVGEINLLGLTLPEAKAVTKKKISSIYKQEYKFSFRLIQPRRVQIYLSGSEDKPLYVGEKKVIYVYGQVSRSGRYEYIPGKKFSDYISYAGGPTPRANFSLSTITRNGKKIRINGTNVIFNGKSSDDIEIIPGDVISVPSQFFYFSDFASFTSLIFTTIALYKTIF